MFKCDANQKQIQKKTKIFQTHITIKTKHLTKIIAGLESLEMNLKHNNNNHPKCPYL